MNKKNENKNKIDVTKNPKYFIERCVPIHIGMLISVYSNSNCKARYTVFLMSIGNNTYIQ